MLIFSPTKIFLAIPNPPSIIKAPVFVEELLSLLVIVLLLNFRFCMVLRLGVPGHVPSPNIFNTPKLV